MPPESNPTGFKVGHEITSNLLKRKLHWAEEASSIADVTEIGLSNAST